MSVLFLAINDWANVAHTYAESLKRVGIKAKAFSMNELDFKYPKIAETYTSFQRMKQVVDAADTVVLMHSHPHFAKLPFDLSEKKVAVFHGGSQYRNNPTLMNAVFNPIVDVSLVQTGDLLGLGAKNEKWVLTGIDTDRIKVRKTPTAKKLIVAHYPHKSAVKGSVFINHVLKKMAKKMDFIYSHNDDVVPYKKNLDRIAKCDIYVEAMMPTLNDKPYGEWGVTALEAAALGKVVVSHHLSRDRYNKTIMPPGWECPIRPISTGKELEDQIKFILTQNIPQMQKDTRKWVVKFHSLKAQGERLKEALEL
jgi:hypothetical protein